MYVWSKVLTAVLINLKVLTNQHGVLCSYKCVCVFTFRRGSSIPLKPYVENIHCSQSAWPVLKANMWHHFFSVVRFTSS